MIVLFSFLFSLFSFLLKLHVYVNPLILRLVTLQDTCKYWKLKKSDECEWIELDRSTYSLCLILIIITLILVTREIPNSMK